MEILYFILLQKKLQAGIEAGEKAVHMVNDLQLFSDNEEIEEVASNELRYVLALLHMTVSRSMFSKNKKKQKKKQEIKETT